MRVIKRTLAAFLVVAGTSVGTASAAGIQVSLHEVNPLEGGWFEWQYRATLIDGSQLGADDLTAEEKAALFVVHNFAGHPGLESEGPPAAGLLGTFTFRATTGNVTFVTGSYSNEDAFEVGTGPSNRAAAPLAAVPEPASLALLGAGLLGLAWRMRARL